MSAVGELPMVVCLFTFSTVVEIFNLLDKSESLLKTRSRIRADRVPEQINDQFDDLRACSPWYQ